MKIVYAEILIVLYGPKISINYDTTHLHKVAYEGLVN